LFERCHHIDSGVDQINYYMGMTHWQLKNRTEACRWLKKSSENGNPEGITQFKQLCGSKS
jgi:uncharacterized protein YjbK